MIRSSDIFGRRCSSLHESDMSVILRHACLKVCVVSENTWRVCYFSHDAAFLRLSGNVLLMVWRHTTCTEGAMPQWRLVLLPRAWVLANYPPRGCGFPVPVSYTTKPNWELPFTLFTKGQPSEFHNAPLY
jgi:hypothetical protein